ncbi:hypothetical protein HY612_04650 [Candidatus Roizmanbacteria bacterium]|nr:hypothetical protein [Candidatus Roizmanbacteria bacterium]
MDYYQSFADEAVAKFEVRGNKIVGSGISIDDSGRAEYFVDLQDVQVSVSYYFSQTQDGAVNLSGDYSIKVSVEDASSSCSGTFGGSRTAL